MKRQRLLAGPRGGAARSVSAAWRRRIHKKYWNPKSASNTYRHFRVNSLFWGARAVHLLASGVVLPRPAWPSLVASRPPSWFTMVRVFRGALLSYSQSSYLALAAGAARSRRRRVAVARHSQHGLAVGALAFVASLRSRCRDRARTGVGRALASHRPRLGRHPPPSAAGRRARRVREGGRGRHGSTRTGSRRASHTDPSRWAAELGHSGDRLRMAPRRPRRPGRRASARPPFSQTLLRGPRPSLPRAHSSTTRSSRIRQI